MAALEACALREQALKAAHALSPAAGFELAAEESAEAYLPMPHGALPYQGTLEPTVQFDEIELAEGEGHWTPLGQELPDWMRDASAGGDGG